ncbi:hypothetical protein VSS74_03075 [Conexibacter stalactiti]|jgi:hypothetical protein|uniref:Uncharacterized protein n=1 Tax=Conexibacter stalactiti TaxID=1940611 RepID=A0ABU4HJ06_9ACTN|nr:hypothetical protein [Conexibacter stalactiti]MDW5593303.1 hypothetical protein [Conexibacter stalactiti]MEC5033944.1 hypothetical protein [Conexibacter stalactiti]
MDTKTVKINDLRARIERADYDVDVDAVAEAFVSRMLVVHGALRRADVRELLGDAYDEIGGGPRKSCS